MSITFAQVNKDLYAADFQIHHQGRTIGQLHLQGRMGSREGQWSGSIMGHAVQMRPEPQARGFRPYGIVIDGSPVGSVGQISVQSGLFSRYQYHELQYGNQVYELYSVGLGKDGGASCLYNGQRQLAQIDRGCKIQNDLHNYEIFAVDEGSALISALLCCYMYVRGCYRPGEQVTSSVAVHTTITTNKILKAKYDPNFKATHRTL